MGETGQSGQGPAGEASPHFSRLNLSPFLRFSRVENDATGLV